MNLNSLKIGSEPLNRVKKVEYIKGDAYQINTLFQSCVVCDEPVVHSIMSDNFIVCKKCNHATVQKKS